MSSEARRLLTACRAMARLLDGYANRGGAADKSAVRDCDLRTEPAVAERVELTAKLRQLLSALERFS